MLPEGLTHVICSRAARGTAASSSVRAPGRLESVPPMRAGAKSGLMGKVTLTVSHATTSFPGADSLGSR